MFKTGSLDRKEQGPGHAVVAMVRTLQDNAGTRNHDGNIKQRQRLPL